MGRKLEYRYDWVVIDCAAELEKRVIQLAAASPPPQLTPNTNRVVLLTSGEGHAVEVQGSSLPLQGERRRSSGY
jgi:hypothetical protein